MSNIAEMQRAAEDALRIHQEILLGTRQFKRLHEDFQNWARLLNAVEEKSKEWATFHQNMKRFQESMRSLNAAVDKLRDFVDLQHDRIGEEMRVKRSKRAAGNNETGR